MPPVQPRAAAVPTTTPRAKQQESFTEVPSPLLLCRSFTAHGMPQLFLLN